MTGSSSQQALDAAAGQKALKQAMFALLATWRGAHYTARLPSQLPAHTATFARGFTGNRESNSSLLGLSQAMVARLRAEVPAIVDDEPTQRELFQTLVRIGANLQDAQATMSNEFHEEDFWEQYLETDVFRLSIWSAMRTCYVAIYNAYDDFVARCAVIATGDDRLRTTDRDFHKRCIAVFGQTIVEKCWSGSAIQVLRLVRHALSHAGGRETSPLRKMKHPFPVEQGEIQILPEHIKHLLRTLEPAVVLLCDAVKNPSSAEK